jgi:hypothetical protein
MLFSAELPWCLVFCAEIQLSRKISENIAKILLYQKTHGARRGDEERLGASLTTRGRGPGLANIANRIVLSYIQTFISFILFDLSNRRSSKKSTFVSCSVLTDFCHYLCLPLDHFIFELF